MEIVGLAAFVLMMGISAVLLALLTEGLLRLMGRVTSTPAGSATVEYPASDVRATPAQRYIFAAAAGAAIVLALLAPFAAANHDTTYLGFVTVIGCIVLAILVVAFIKARTADVIESFLAKRRASAKVVGRATLVEGLERIPVALALTATSFYYENADLEASIDLPYVDEVEYDDETSTGQSVVGKVLRLRSHGQIFEFVLDAALAQRWSAVLPAARADLSSPTSEIA